MTVKGLQQFVNIKATMNLGLSAALMSEFKEIIPVPRPLIFTEAIPDPIWLSGFVAGEGKFYIGFKANLRMKVGYDVYLKFRITQHKRDKHLMGLIINYLGQVDLKINLV